MSEIVFI